MQLSNVHVQLDNSYIFLRVALLTYSFCFLILIHTEWDWVLKLFITFLLVFKIFQISLQPKPYPNYLSLSYDPPLWVLKMKKNKKISFQNANILMDCGLFFLLKLESSRSSRILIIFSDQISKSAFRFIKLNKYL